LFRSFSLHQLSAQGATEAQDFIIINPKNGPFNVSKFKEACGESTAFSTADPQ
jgi:hypothetical protein